MKSVEHEHVTVDPRLHHRRVHAPSSRELKSEKSSRCRGKWVRRLRRRLVIRVRTYSGAERFAAKGTWLYIERAEGECSRRRRGLRNEAMSASVTCV